jgi:hypothetical protein
MGISRTDLVLVLVRVGSVQVGSELIQPAGQHLSIAGYSSHRLIDGEAVHGVRLLQFLEVQQS